MPRMNIRAHLRVQRAAHVLLAGVGVACARTPQSASPADTRQAIESRAQGVLAALKARDGERLASYVHPVEGVRFSPYQYVHADSDVVLHRDEIARAWSSTDSRVWGYSDGSGEPLRYPFDTYYRRFVWDQDYTTAPRVAYNSPPLRAGNTPNNIPQTYPSSIAVEYHFPGLDPKYEGMDWRSLWLVFQKHQDQWFLVGIVHASWTI